MAKLKDILNIKEIEQKSHDIWNREGINNFSQKSSLPIFSIDSPPPYVSADFLHVGHGSSYAQADFIARYKRMNGFNVFYPIGYDDNGLPTEIFVEKKYKINKRDIERSKFIELCLNETEKYRTHYQNLFSKLGISSDNSLNYSTIGDSCQRLSQELFLDLLNDGIITKRKDPTHWCTKCNTAIAEAELEETEQTTNLNYIKFGLNDGSVLPVATTRPELIPACVAVFYNPLDSKFTHLKGKEAIVPLYNYKVKILPSAYVDPNFGTGILMLSTFGDKNDIELWREFNLDQKIVLDSKGNLNELSGKYKGMSSIDVRKEIIKELQSKEFLIKQESLEQMVKVHERCKRGVEFIPTDQWFLNLLDYKADFLKQIEKIDWRPENYKSRITDWVNNLKWDWCISRQRYYGVPIPVWYDKKGEVILPKKEELPVDPRNGFPKGYDKNNLTSEMSVMDTWMTSSITPQICEEIANKNGEKSFIPMSMRPQAHDIIRTWAFYTIVRSLYHKNEIPWKTVMISGHGLDNNGKGMHKSIGNVVNLEKTIDEFGADELRLWAASPSLGSDLKFSDTELKVAYRFLNKLWNASKLVSQYYKKTDMKNLGVMDNWLLHGLNNVISETTLHFENYNFNKAKESISKFFWNDFCDNYLEIIKHRMRGTDEEDKKRVSGTLYKSHLSILKLFAPIIPHTTEEIYQNLYREYEGDVSICKSAWPKSDDSFNNLEDYKLGESAVSAISKIRCLKSQKKASMNECIDSLVLCSPEPENLLKITDIIKFTMNVNNLVIKKGDILEVREDF